MASYGGGQSFSLSFNLFPFLCNFTISLTSLYIQILVRVEGMLDRMELSIKMEGEG